MSWGKLIGDLAKAAASKYVEERGVNGMIEDAGKVASFAKNSLSKAGSLFSADTNNDGEIDADEMQDWLDSFIPEMESCLKEATNKNVLSKEFEENIQFVLNTGYDAINQLLDADEDLAVDGGYADQINSVCNRALELISKKCDGSMSSGIPASNINLPFSMEVKGSYPVNFYHNMTIITGTVMSGEISKDDIISLPSGEAASIKFIQMFGKTLEGAECGDICALVLDGDFYSDLESLTPFVIGNVPTASNNAETEAIISKEEQEYLTEIKACLEEDGIISDKERRILNKLRQSLGISEERANELEVSLSASQNLTSDEQEYADEIKACLEDDGGISSKERRLLDKLRNSLGITPDRAKEIEDNLMKS